MTFPKGFDLLVQIAMKERPSTTKTKEELWDKFLYSIFMGGKRSEPEVRLIVAMLKAKSLLGLPEIIKISCEDWQYAVEKVLEERKSKIKDEQMLVMLKDFEKELFRISASIKGAARFFDKNISPEKLKELDTKEKMSEFIEELANDPDVPNIKYTKIILWLHDICCGYDFCPPSWHVKSFLNSEIGPYYQFYEDDKYFMKKAEEFT